ncbi:MAG TPA: isochorismatase family protein [Candidatus Saccharimonadales bacterium]|jgi:nicotinamidase/pyrazinamidase
MNESLSPAPQNCRDVLVAVDVQNDFITGSLAVTNGELVIAPLNKLATDVRGHGGQVIVTRDHHPETTPHFDTWPVHCVAGTPGAEFHPALDVQTGDIVISKGMGQTDGYSGMEGYDLESGVTLEQLLRPERADEHVRVMLGGLATDFCVRATLLDIAKTFRGDERVRTYLVRDAVRAVNLKPGDEAEALSAMEAAGAIALTSREIREDFYGTV